MQNDVDLESYASWKERWVEYTSDDLTIKAYGDWTSRETVWINGERASNKFSWKLRTQHIFQYDGTEFRVEFHVTNILTGVIKISAFRGEKQLFEDTKPMFEDTKELFKWWTLPVIFVVSGAIGYLVGYLEGRFFS